MQLIVHYCSITIQPTRKRNIFHIFLIHHIMHSEDPPWSHPDWIPVNLFWPSHQPQPYYHFISYIVMSWYPISADVLDHLVTSLFIASTIKHCSCIQIGTLSLTQLSPQLWVLYIRWGHFVRGSPRRHYIQKIQHKSYDHKMHLNLLNPNSCAFFEDVWKTKACKCLPPESQLLWRKLCKHCSAPSQVPCTSPFIPAWD